MQSQNLEKSVEKPATTERISIVCERAPEGKIRVTSGSWDGEKVILKRQVLEIRNVEQRLHVARKIRHHDDWNPPIDPYDPYGSGRWN